MRVMKKAVFLFCLFGMSWQSTSLAQFPGTSSLRRILNARKAGKIDFQTYIRYKAYALSQPELLPKEYNSSYPEKCATQDVREVFRYLYLLDMETQGRFRTRFLPESHVLANYPSTANLTEKLTTTNFDIHYTKNTQDGDVVRNPQVDLYAWDGASPNGHPDYVDDTAKYFEESLTFITGNLGYISVPKKKFLRYQVYITGNSFNALGITTECFNSDLNPTDFCYWIHPTMNFNLLNDDPEGNVKGLLKATVSHEFFHGVQGGYDWMEDGVNPDCNTYCFWFHEATATWIEDKVYPQVNDYARYLPEFLSSPGSIPLDDAVSGIHQYGASIFAKFLTESHSFFQENFGNGIIRSIWERCAQDGLGGKSLPKISQELTGRGTTLAEVFTHFNAANFLKDYQFDADKIPSVSPTKTLEAGTTGADATIAFNGQDATPWGATLIKVKTDGSREVQLFSLNSSGDGNVLFSGWGTTITSAILVASNAAFTGTPSFQFSFTNSGTNGGTLTYLGANFILFRATTTAKITKTYSLPLRSGTVKFKADFIGDCPALVRVEVFTLSGKKVAEIINPSPGCTGNYEVLWENAKRLPNGVYLYRIEFVTPSATHSKSGKIAILK